MVKVLTYPWPNEHKVKSFDFSAGEVQVRVDPIPPNAKEVTIESDIRNSRDFMETCLTLNAINHMEGVECPVRLILRYLPYSRQDRPCATGEAFSLEVSLAFLATFLNPNDTLVTWDVHSEVAGSEISRNFPGVNFFNLTAAALLRDLSEVKGISFSPDTIVISPDKGAVERATEVKSALGLSEVIYASKVRDPNTGAILRTEVPEEISYEGRPLLIVDDICDGGRTFIELAKVLRKYNPSRIDLYVTHGIFSKGFLVFEDLIDNFFVANLFPPSTGQNFPENLIALYRQ